MPNLELIGYFKNTPLEKICMILFCAASIVYIIKESRQFYIKCFYRPIKSRIFKVKSKGAEKETIAEVEYR